MPGHSTIEYAVVAPEGEQVVRKRVRVVGEKVCEVCGDKALAHHFGALTCETCKAFFRRNAAKVLEMRPCSKGGKCDINTDTRRNCPACRLKKCFDVGMKPELIFDEDQKRKLKEKMQKTQSKRLHVSNTVTETFQGQDGNTSGSSNSTSRAVTTSSEGSSDGFCPPTVNSSMPLNTPETCLAVSEESTNIDHRVLAASSTVYGANGCIHKGVINCTGGCMDEGVKSSGFYPFSDSSSMSGTEVPQNGEVVNIIISETDSTQWVQSALEEKESFARPADVQPTLLLQLNPPTHAASVNSTEGCMRHGVNSNLMHAAANTVNRNTLVHETTSTINSTGDCMCKGVNSSGQPHSSGHFQTAVQSLDMQETRQQANDNSLAHAASVTVNSSGDCMYKGVYNGQRQISEDSQTAGQLLPDTQKTPCQPPPNSSAAASNTDTNANKVPQVFPSRPDLTHLSRAQLPSDPQMYWRLTEEERMILTLLSTAYENTVLSELNDCHKCPKFDMSQYNITEFLKDYDALTRSAISFVKQLEDFKKLEMDDQIACFKGSISSVMTLRSAFIYIVERNTWISHRGEFTADTIIRLFPCMSTLDCSINIYRSMKAVAKNDVTLYALLHCILVFDPGNDKITDRQLVSVTRDKYVILLRHYLESVFSYVYSEEYIRYFQDMMLEINALNKYHKEQTKASTCKSKASGTVEEIFSYDLLCEIHSID